jgi:hypothetical protein
MVTMIEEVKVGELRVLNIKKRLSPGTIYLR